MIDTKLTHQAMKLAYKAHEGQYDESGVAYIFHPFHVAEQMDDEISVCAALLHDILEDTDVTLEMLEEEFPPEVTEAVVLLTHKHGTDYEEYLRKIKANPIARKVKIADVHHNAEESRILLAEVPEARKNHWRKKYQKALVVLENE